MEDILFAASVVAFVLALCALVAAVVIFIKADVPRALRFLRHRTIPTAQPVGQGLAPAAPAPQPVAASTTPEPPTYFLPLDDSSSDATRKESPCLN